MAERSTLNQIVQLGVETTPGTVATVTKKLAAASIEPSPQVEVDQFRPAGQKFKTFTALGKEWATASLSGRLTYNEIVYLLSSVVSSATITTPGGATNARNWSFASSPYVDDTPKTFTVEHGSSVRADRFTYGLVNEIGLNFSRQSCEISGSMMGKAIEDNFAGGLTTSGVTQLSLLPVLPTQVSIYMAATRAGLGGASKLTRVLGAEWSLGNRYNPVWPIDASLAATYAAIIESEPDLSMSLTMEADAAGMGPLANLRAGDTRYIRIEGVGAEIDAGVNNNKFTLDTCVQVTGTGGFSDQDGVYAIQWNFAGITDGSWSGGARAFQIDVVNALTAL